jgi:hypothetical protein
MVTLKVALLLVVMAPVEATEGNVPAKQWVWLAKQGVWGYGYQIPDGPDRGLWRVDPGSKRAPAAGDPYGFVSLLNDVRASYSLPAVGYDPDLSSWAAANNSQQQVRGMGHHVQGPARHQNAGWNYASAQAVLRGWMGSPGHRAALLDPTIRWYGIAWTGAYWTANFR